MDSGVFWRSMLIQGGAVLLLGVALAVALPHSFFEEWGWLSGPVAWVGCAAVVALVLGLPVPQTLIGAVLVGLPSLLVVAVGLHWLGPLLVLPLFGAWCGRLARDPDLPAEWI